LRGCPRAQQPRRSSRALKLDLVAFDGIELATFADFGRIPFSRLFGESALISLKVD